MRIAYLSVSDQLGGSEIVLLEMIKGVRRLRPDWALQVILPGRGPLLDQAEAAGADCVVLPMPPSLARLGESGAGRRRARRPPRAGGARAARLPPSPAHHHQGRPSRDPPHQRLQGAHRGSARARGREGRLAHARIHRRPARHAIAARQASTRRCGDDRELGERRGRRDRRASTGRRPCTSCTTRWICSTFAPDGPVEDLDRRAGLTPPAGPGRARRPGGDLRALEGTRRVPAGAGGDPGRRAGPRLRHRRSGVRHGRQPAHDGRAAGACRMAWVCSGRVGFTGFLPPAPAMRALDVVVHASTRPEPFGLVIAEAMACGRAVITSASGGAAELVDAGEDALDACAWRRRQPVGVHHASRRAIPS